MEKELLDKINELHFLKGIKVDVVATAMGVSVHTVRHGVEIIRKRLAEASTEKKPDSMSGDIRACFKLTQTQFKHLSPGDLFLVNSSDPYAPTLVHRCVSVPRKNKDGVWLADIEMVGTVETTMDKETRPAVDDLFGGEEPNVHRDTDAEERLRDEPVCGVTFRDLVAETLKMAKTEGFVPGIYKDFVERIAESDVALMLVDLAAFSAINLLRKRNDMELLVVDEEHLMLNEGELEPDEDGGDDDE